MSLRDDTIIRDERGRIVKGSSAINKAKQAQSDQPDPAPDTDTPSPDFDAAIIAAANNFGTSTKPKMGLAGYCANLMESRPVEYAALLKSALARKADASYDPSTITPGVQISFVTAPSGMYVDENGKLIEAEGARAEWARRTSHQDEPPPASKPVLIHPRAEVPALSANEITFGGGDDDDED